jgi:diguanylate cyclase (GGDEF)-like protein
VSTVRTVAPSGPRDDGMAFGAVAWHTATAEELAAAGHWEQAYQHLRTAVRMLHGQPPADELDRLRREHAEAREQSRRDSLTATYNRRYLDERLAALLNDSASRGSAGLSVALLDVDHFKQINDTYGHQFGDRVLQRLVIELDAGLPDGAFCARYGGEEFALVLPGHELDEAVRVCEAARHRIDRHAWHELDPDLRVTVSAGVAHTADPVTEIERLVGTADTLLYAAKHSGRNAVAFRDDRTGAVRLAGAAGGRRSIRQPARVSTPACDLTGSAP